MKKYRFATIGTNFIVKQFLEAALLLPEFEWYGAYSRNQDTGLTFIRENSSKPSSITLYTNIDDLAADTMVDAVYIASPTAYHKEQALLMLQNGKHVLCEKPAAVAKLEWLEMQTAADTARVVLLEAMRPLHTPTFELLKNSLPELGTLRYAAFHYCQYSSRYDNFKNGIIENAFRPELSNGALMDIGIYCIEMMLGLLGMPLDIYSHSHILQDSIDGCGSAIAVYDGLHCTLTYSKISHSDFGCEIQGEHATLTFKGMNVPQNGKITYSTGEEKIVFEAPSENDMRYELSSFINMIEQRISSNPYHEITANALHLTDVIRKQNEISFLADK